MLVATMSSIPPRFGLIGPALDSLLAQTRAPDRIELYIPESYRRFPDWDGALPQVPDGVTIVRCAADLGPATKVLYAARAYRGQDVHLLVCDDDRAYPPDLAATLLASARAHPGAAIATRGLPADRLLGQRARRKLRPRALPRDPGLDLEFHLARLWCRLRHGPGAPPPRRRPFRRSGYIDAFEGCGGVLLRPDFLDDAAFDIPAVAWGVDDIWLSGMLAHRGVPVWLVANRRSPPNTGAQARAPLAEATIGGVARGEANRQAVRYMQATYGIWT